MLRFVLLCLIILCLIQNVDSLEIKGTYHTWLITLPLPIDIVKHMLPVGVSLDTPTGFGLPLGTHPIILELGRELNCGPVIFKFLQTNFMEAKFDIPFVQIENNPGIFNLKQVVYVDSVQ
ncbi:hypothetical protein SNE40_012872 [Patella caerulea]|uniref:Uncharacterized protein n=1 Tax=Patella caerulea TaxID=87958 RepID=A0AAN8PMG1_PATCE